MGFKALSVVDIGRENGRVRRKEEGRIGKHANTRIRNTLIMHDGVVEGRGTRGGEPSDMMVKTKRRIKITWHSQGPRV